MTYLLTYLLTDSDTRNAKTFLCKLWRGGKITRLYIL